MSGDLIPSRQSLTSWKVMRPSSTSFRGRMPLLVPRQAQQVVLLDSAWELRFMNVCRALGRQFHPFSGSHVYQRCVLDST